MFYVIQSSLRIGVGVQNTDETRCRAKLEVAARFFGIGKARENVKGTGSREKKQVRVVQRSHFQSVIFNS